MLHLCYMYTKYNFLSTVVLLLMYIHLFQQISPVKIYLNFYSDRAKIRSDHKGKVSGIYMFVNLLMPFKWYVAKSSNILGRMNNYLNNANLKSRKNRNSPFISSQIKYGQSGFCLMILEYVPVDSLDTRESFWISLLKPYYNVLPGGSAGSTGYTHSDETKALLRAQNLGTVQSEATEALISKATAGVLNPFYGKVHSAASTLSISMSKSSGVVYVYNSMNELMVIISSVKMLSKFILANHSSITDYIKYRALFRGGWYFTLKPNTPTDKPIITDQESNEAKELFT